MDKVVSTAFGSFTDRLLGRPPAGHGPRSGGSAPASMALGGWSSTGAMRLPARVDLGPIGLVLVSRKRLVDDIEARLGAESVHKLWLTLRGVASTLGASGSDEDRWRYLHAMWFNDSYDQMIEPMLADVAEPLAALAAVLAEGQVAEEPLAAARTSTELSAHEIKGRGAVVMLLLAAIMGGYIRARRLSVSSVYLAVIGLVNLWDQSIEAPLTP